MINYKLLDDESVEYIGERLGLHTADKKLSSYTYLTLFAEWRWTSKVSGFVKNIGLILELDYPRVLIESIACE